MVKSPGNGCRMRKKGANAKTRIKLLALLISIIVHIVIFIFFGNAYMSRSTAHAIQRQAPLTKISSLTSSPRSPVIPKPKVKKYIERHLPDQSQTSRPLTDIFKEDALFQTIEPPKDSQNDKTFKPLLSSPVIQQGVEFFGSWTAEHKICYVVDSSGSMQGIFGQVREKLKSSIELLQPNQHFNIIFFGDGRLIEFTDKGLVRASATVKEAAQKFIDQVRPTGTTNAAEALERAVKLRDEKAAAPELIFFLTDGFELTGQQGGRELERIGNIFDRFGPKTKVNTIGFWPNQDDRRMLKMIANRTNGEFVCVTDNAEN